MNRALLGQRSVVLVVEDESLVRSTAMDMVEEAGFEAIAASDADEAIRPGRSRACTGRFVPRMVLHRDSIADSESFRSGSQGGRLWLFLASQLRRLEGVFENDEVVPEGRPKTRVETEGPQNDLKISRP
jgi:CheY-like chemotaxis protein